jgi:hypothetical protein
MEKLVFGIIVVFAAVMGIAPGPILSRSAASVDALVDNYRARLGEARAKPSAPAHLSGSAIRRQATSDGRPTLPRRGGAR